MIDPKLIILELQIISKGIPSHYMKSSCAGELPEKLTRLGLKCYPI